MTFPIRRAARANDRGMIGLEELVNPITYSYVVQAPWGATRQVLTVEAPGLVDQPRRFAEIGRAHV